MVINEMPFYDINRRADAISIANYVRNEYPQTTAVILSYLDKSLAHQVIECLSEEMQVEVIRKMCIRQTVPLEIIKGIDEILSKAVLTEENDNEKAMVIEPSFEDAIEVLDWIVSPYKEKILKALEDEDPELAEEIKKRMFFFKDIALLNDKQLRYVFKRVEYDTVLIALKQSEDKILEKRIINSLSFFRRIFFYRKQTKIGNIEVSQVQFRQKIITDIIVNLENKKELIIDRKNGEVLT